MNAVFFLLLLSGLPDPASVIVSVQNTRSGLFCTDGRHTGLYLADNEEELEVISLQPGAGRNAVFADGGILFKECPEGELQRTVFMTSECELTVLFEGDFFSGPFECAPGSFLIAEPGRLTEYNLQGEEIQSWSINGFPAWAARSGGSLFYTGETGGIEMLDIQSGTVSAVPGCGEFTYSRIETGFEGFVLAEKSPCGFVVLDSSGSIILDNPEGYFPSWTLEGNVICSRLAFDGMEPVGGKLCRINPRSGEELLLAVEGIPLYPCDDDCGGIIWTDAESGTVHGFDVPLLPEINTDFCMDDPDAHFDVGYMHQRWDTPDWFNGSWSCGPTSCMMTVQYYMRLTPDSIWASYPTGHWSLWGNYIPVEYTFLGCAYDALGESPGGVMVPGAHGFICPDGGAWWNNMVTFLNQHEVNSAWAGTAWSTLTGEIDSSYPVVCSSSVLGYGHIILLIGYYSNHTIVVNDPYGDANESGWGSYYNGKDVLYDWPGYNNGHLQIGVSQLFCAQANVPDEPDTLVDDCSRGFYKYSDCRYWHLTGNGYDGNAWWTYSTAALPDTCIAEWHPVLPHEGSYDVSVYIPPDHAEASGIYKIQTSTGLQEMILNQGLYSGEWALLGTYSLDYDSYLRLGDYTGAGGQYIAFDAARFSPNGTGIWGEECTVPVQDIQVCPNPCRELASIRIPPENEGASVEVYDTSGRLVSKVESSESAENVQLDVSNFSTGLYLLRIFLRGTGNTTYSRLLTVCR